MAGLNVNNFDFNFEEAVIKASKKERNFTPTPSNGATVFKQLPVGVIGIDVVNYQRPISQANLNKMRAHGFRDDYAGTILVAERPDGTFWAVDGGHRLTFAKECGKLFINCQVKKYEFISDEAIDFAILNKGYKPVGPAERFRADLLTGDPIAIGVESVVNELGYHLDCYKRHKPGGSLNGIGCLDLCKTIYKETGPIVFKNLLKICAASFPDSDKRFSQWTIKSVGMLMSRYRNNVNWNFFVKKMKEIPLDLLYNEAKNRQRLDNIGVDIALFIQMRNYYNKCRPKIKLVESN